MCWVGRTWAAQVVQWWRILLPVQEMQEAWVQSLSGEGLGRSPGGGNGSPLQYSCLGNPKDRGAWRAAVRGRKESGRTCTHTRRTLPTAGNGLGSQVWVSPAWSSSASHTTLLCFQTHLRGLLWKLSEIICIKVHMWNVNKCSEQWHRITLPATDVKLWFQISTYFHKKAEPHTCDKVWTRWCVIGRALGKLLSVMTGSGCWHTGDENLVNCVNLSKFTVFRMWKVTMDVFFTFGFCFCFLRKRCCMQWKVFMYALLTPMAINLLVHEKTTTDFQNSILTKTKSV